MVPCRSIRLRRDPLSASTTSKPRRSKRRVRIVRLSLMSSTISRRGADSSHGRRPGRTGLASGAASVYRAASWAFDAGIRLSFRPLAHLRIGELLSEQLSSYAGLFAHPCEHADRKARSMTKLARCGNSAAHERT